MSERTLKWLVGALAVVVVAWAAITFLGNRSGPPAGSSKLIAFFKGLTPAAVSSVNIVGPKDTVHLTRKDGVWKADGAETDSATVADFWRNVKGATVEDLVATNPKNHRRLGVAADSTWKVTFDASGGPRTLYVGHSSPTSYTAGYVRLPSQNSVYLVEGGLWNSVERSLDEWRNKKIVAVDSSAVVRLDVKHGHDSFDLVRKDSVWRFAKGARADTAAVHNILSALTDLKAIGFYHSADSLPAQGATFVALNGEGDTLTALRVGSGEDDRWVRARGDTDLYKVAAYRLDRLMPKLSSLEERPAKKTAAKKTAVRKAPKKGK